MDFLSSVPNRDLHRKFLLLYGGLKDTHRRMKRDDASVIFQQIAARILGSSKWQSALPSDEEAPFSSAKKRERKT